MEVKNLVLGITISVIFVMFFVYGTKLIYEEPDYSDFCSDSYGYPDKFSAKSCNFSAELQGKITECYSQEGTPRYEYDDLGCEKDLTCDLCNKEYNTAREKYTKDLFLISLVLGLIVIAFSAIVVKIAAVSGGLMFGSLMFIIYGTAGYWEFMEGLLRFSILGAVLASLIWLAYYLSKKKIKRKK